jgi:hypothetical protein
VVYSFPGESADLDVMLADSPHSITVAGVTRPCFYDLRSEVGPVTGSAAPQVLEMEIATVKTADYPAIADGAAVSVAEWDGLLQAWTVNYTVLRHLRGSAFTELMLQRV